MTEYVKEYYEASVFWDNKMLEDPVNNERFEFTSSLIPLIVKNLADIGCGNGVFVNRLRSIRPDLKICAVDRSLKALEFVVTNKIQAEIVSLPFKDNEFDCITCLEVLEHLNIDEFNIALSEISRVAKQFIIVSVPFAEKLDESPTQCPKCKTIFNYEFHLQSFGEDRFMKLLDDYGFKNIKAQKLNSIISYKWYFKYRKLFYPEQLMMWRSPICPFCGFKAEQNKTESIQTIGEQKKNRKFISYLSFLPKLFWPKEQKHYWIIGLFEKK